MSWPPPLFLHHPRLGWTVDASLMGLRDPALAALPWARVFDDLAAVESGALANVDEGRQVGHFWLRTPQRAPTLGQAQAITEAREAVIALAQAVRSGQITADGQPFTDVLHIGIGGSALGPNLLVDALGGEGLAVHFLDNTDPDGIHRVLNGLGERLRSTLLVVVTKSGSTVETRNALLMARRAVEALGIHAPSRLVAITVRGSKLDQLAQEQGWLRVLPIWDWVGGRFSVTSAVGLLPAALAGADVSALLAGAAEMDQWTRSDDWRHNPAALLAAAWYLAGEGRGDRNVVVLPYADRLILLSRYLQQLVMESLGKRCDRQGRVVEQGLTVFGNKGSTDQHAFVQQLRDGRNDFSVVFVQVLDDADRTEVTPGVRVGDYLQGFLLGTRRALAEGDRPSITLTVPRVDATSLGGFVALFERAVAFYGSLIDVNAYHQPGVEAGKLAAGEALALSARVQQALGRDTQPVASIATRADGDPLEVFYLLERLVQSDRAVREGVVPDASYRRRLGRD